MSSYQRHQRLDHDLCFSGWSLVDFGGQIRMFSGTPASQYYLSNNNHFFLEGTPLSPTGWVRLDLIIGFRLLYYSDVCSGSHFDTPWFQIPNPGFRQQIVELADERARLRQRQDRKFPLCVCLISMWQLPDQTELLCYTIQHQVTHCCPSTKF